MPFATKLTVLCPVARAIMDIVNYLSETEAIKFYKWTNSKLYFQCKSLSFVSKDKINENKLHPFESSVGETCSTLQKKMLGCTRFFNALWSIMNNYKPGKMALMRMRFLCDSSGETFVHLIIHENNPTCRNLMYVFHNAAYFFKKKRTHWQFVSNWQCSKPFTWCRLYFESN